MKFDIGTWWHWLFIFAATLGSAWNACRMMFESYDASHSSLFPPIWQFFYELAGSFAGWMGLWYLLPVMFTCAGGDCHFQPTWTGALLLVLAAVGIFGKIPDAVHWLADSVQQLVSGRA